MIYLFCNGLKIVQWRRYVFMYLHSVDAQTLGFY